MRLILAVYLNGFCVAFTTEPQNLKPQFHHQLLVTTSLDGAGNVPHEMLAVAVRGSCTSEDLSDFCISKV